MKGKKQRITEEHDEEKKQRITEIETILKKEKQHRHKTETESITGLRYESRDRR
jgi:hypothetical protein